MANLAELEQWSRLVFGQSFTGIHVAINEGPDWGGYFRHVAGTLPFIGVLHLVPRYGLQVFPVHVLHNALDSPVSPYQWRDWLA